MSALLLIGTGPRHAAAIRSLLQAGFELLLVDEFGSPFLPLAHRGIGVNSLTDAAEVNDAASALLQGAPPAAVITLIDEGLPSVAALSEAFSLPGISEEAARLALRKDLMRASFAKAGLPQPRFQICNTLAEAQRAAATLGFPVVFKPCDRTGSVGVQRVDSADGIESAFQYAASRCMNTELGVIVEQWLAGALVEIEVAVCGGRVHVFSIHTSSAPVVISGNPISNGAAAPFRHRTIDFPALGEAAIAASAIDNAVAFVQCLSTENGPRILEVNARPGGPPWSLLANYGAGIDQFRLAAALSQNDANLTAYFLGQPWRRAVAFEWLAIPRGLLRSVTGLADVSRLPSILDVQLFANPGEWVPALVAEGVRHGYVIAHGENLREARRAARHGGELLSFHTV